MTAAGTEGFRLFAQALRKPGNGKIRSRARLRIIAKGGEK